MSIIVNPFCVSYFQQYDTQFALCLSESTQTMIKQLINNRYAWERDVLYPLATRQIDIDLDDGVKVNYLKFGTALKKIPGLDEKEDE